MKTVKHFNVMLVEDEPLIRQSLARHIEALDEAFRVVCQASDGKNALEQLKSQNIHLIITDVQMPVMDGLVLAKHIHETHPRILTIILTGFADFTYAREALRQGVFDYLLKPVNDEALASVLSKTRLQLQKDYALEDEIPSSGKNSRQIVDNAAEYIQTHYMEDIDFSAIAGELGFSSAYLTKLFNKYIGDTPLKYLTDIRMEEARKLLANTSLPIREVGEKVGYPDQFHFSKTFRKATGKNPTAFRKENTG